MEFRPCIDIHNGKVKQIIGGSLQDHGDFAKENYVSAQDARFFAGFYHDKGLKGGHIILLNSKDSPFYEETKGLALDALRAYPGDLQLGGGITAENAGEFLDAGASHVIVTSYVFSDGKINWRNLEKLENSVGKEKLVLDLSCRKKGDDYFVVTDRWQNFTQEKLSEELLVKLKQFCDEFLIHAVDVEGRASGIEHEVVKIMKGVSDTKSTYAGGVGSYEDIRGLKAAGEGRINVTIGSALDLFGGALVFDEVMKIIYNN